MSLEEPIAPKPVPPPSPTPKQVPAPAPSGKSAFPVILFAVFVVVIGASVYAERAMMPAPTPSAVTAPPAAESAKTNESVTPTPTPTPTPAAATADDVKALKAEIAALTQKVEAMPKAEPTPDLKPVHEKLDGLAKTVDAVADAPKKIKEDLSNKLAEAEKADTAMKTDIDALKAEVASLKDAMKAKPAVADESPKPAPGVDAAAMTAAVDLFKAGKYADALAAFKKLPADDARVLYYTALASGFSTNNWKGDTEAAVTKGVDREKAGSPAKADIDAAFAGLTKAQGKDWLDAYRARAK